MARSNDVTLVLVRCGQTEWDGAGRLQGQTDLPLSDAGRAAAALELDALTDEPLGTILTAADEASIQTAQLLSDRTGAKIRKVAALTEPSFGLWEGLTDKELAERYPKAFGQWSENPATATAPEGESLEEASARILNALARAMEKAGKQPAALVLRPTVFALVRCWLLGEPLSRLWEVMETSSAIERHTAARSTLRDRLQELRAGA